MRAHAAGDMPDRFAACETAHILETRWPRSAVAWQTIGSALRKLDRPRAIAAYRKALELQPDWGLAWGGLGNLLCADGNLAEAEHALRRAIDLEPMEAIYHTDLGLVLRDAKRFDEAIAAHEKAIELDRDLPQAHVNLGTTLRSLGKPAEAADAHRRAIALRPAWSTPYHNLGSALSDQGLFDEAVAAHEKAVELSPAWADAWNGLGLALKGKRDFERAIEILRHAIALRPGWADPHVHLALVFQDQRRLDDAIVELRQALEVEPRHATANYDLGIMLMEQGRAEEAIEQYRKTIEVAPEHAEAHCNLGVLLRDGGQFREALEALRRGHELGRREPGWGYSSEEWVRDCEALVRLDDLAGCILAGEVTPPQLDEIKGMVRARRLRRRFADVARLWQAAFAARPEMESDVAAGNRFLAARAAVLAGASESEEAADEGRSRWRHQALEWLQADLQAMRDLMERGRARGTRIQKILDAWKEVADLETVRSPEALQGLPQPERQGWQSLWTDVEALLGSLE
jgi:tetratricopeptide (TPR) repeat protein